MTASARVAKLKIQKRTVGICYRRFFDCWMEEESFFISTFSAKKIPLHSNKITMTGFGTSFLLYIPNMAFSKE